MAVPSLPTALGVVRQALKRAGRTSPTDAQLQEALEEQLQEVKADIMLVAPTHDNLLVTATTITTRGQQRYSVPEDFNIQQSITLLNSEDRHKGTAQGGSEQAIILSASTTLSSDEIVGKYILLTSDPGIEEYREIMSYDSGTFTAIVDLPWASIPTTNTTYSIITEYSQLYPTDVPTEFDKIIQSTVLGKPEVAAIFGQEFFLYPVPSTSTYGLMNRYWADLSLLDESGDLFIQLLREWRSLWIQGVAVKSMQRFDEDRYQSELMVYDRMLTALSTQTSRVTQVRYKDI